MPYLSNHTQLRIIEQQFEGFKYELNQYLLDKRTTGPAEEVIVTASRELRESNPGGADEVLHCSLSFEHVAGALSLDIIRRVNDGQVSRFSRLSTAKQIMGQALYEEMIKIRRVAVAQFSQEGGGEGHAQLNELLSKMNEAMVKARAVNRLLEKEYKITPNISAGDMEKLLKARQEAVEAEQAVVDSRVDLRIHTVVIPKGEVSDFERGSELFVVGSRVRSIGIAIASGAAAVAHLGVSVAADAASNSGGAATQGASEMQKTAAGDMVKAVTTAHHTRRGRNVEAAWVPSPDEMRGYERFYYRTERRVKQIRKPLGRMIDDRGLLDVEPLISSLNLFAKGRITEAALRDGIDTFGAEKWLEFCSEGHRCPNKTEQVIASALTHGLELNANSVNTLIDNGKLREFYTVASNDFSALRDTDKTKFGNSLAGYIEQRYSGAGGDDASCRDILVSVLQRQEQLAAIIAQPRAQSFSDYLVQRRCGRDGGKVVYVISDQQPQQASEQGIAFHGKKSHLVYCNSYASALTVREHYAPTGKAYDSHGGFRLHSEWSEEQRREAGSAASAVQERPDNGVRPQQPRGPGGGG